MRLMTKVGLQVSARAVEGNYLMINEEENQNLET